MTHTNLLFRTARKNTSMLIRRVAAVRIIVADAKQTGNPPIKGYVVNAFAVGGLTTQVDVMMR